VSAQALIVKLDKVDVDIDGASVLTDVSLEIRKGQHIGITGNNGSGKSTLLALIAGQRWPAPGRGRRVYDFGQGPERDAVTARSRIALIGHELQDRYVARGWNYRVRDVVLSGLTRTDIPRRHPREIWIRRARELLEAMGLIDLADRRLLELSRGQQRRVLITRALAFEPALLLLDEPASGLDPGARAGLFETLEAAARSTSLVIATHRVDELPPLVTDRFACAAGRVSRGPTTDAHAAEPVSGSGSPPGRRTPATRETMIAVENADVWLDGRHVLQELDLTLTRGENWLVTGPNGAGKSTLLRLLHGEIRPARGGRIRWPGLGDPRDVWSLRRKIALVSAELQARYLYPTRVFDAVASGFNASIGLTRRLSPAEVARVEVLLDAFGLSALGDRLLTSLSYGQRHRALIARTLTTEPQILLLDEPWEGLDAGSRAIVRRELDRRMDEGTQVICVSHIGAGGLRFTRSLRLVAGRVVSDGGSAGPSES